MLSDLRHSKVAGLNWTLTILYRGSLLSTNFGTWEKLYQWNSTSTNFIPIALKFVLVEFVLVETVLLGDPLYIICYEISGPSCIISCYLLCGRSAASLWLSLILIREKVFNLSLSPGSFWSCPKLYIQSTINIWKKALTKAIWADKKWAGLWQISLYIK